MDTSRLPGPPLSLHLGIRLRSERAHRIAFRIISDIVAGGVVHNLHIARGGSTATMTRTIWPDANVTSAARPMAQIPRAQTAANDAFVYSSVMWQEYSVVGRDAVPDRTLTAHDWRAQVLRIGMRKSRRNARRCEIGKGLELRRGDRTAVRGRAVAGDRL